MEANPLLNSGLPVDIMTVSLEVGVQNGALAILIALFVLKSLPAAKLPGAAVVLRNAP